MRKLSLFLLFIFALSATSCRFNMGRKVEGNGNRQTRNYSIADFTEVNVDGPMTVYITQGTGFSVKVEADENLFEYLEIEKDGRELEIDSRNNYNLRSRGGIKVWVTAPTYEAAEIAGSGKIISQSKLTNTDKIRIDVAGSGDVQLDIDAPEVDANVAGSGNVLLTGATKELSVDIAGSGDVRAFNLMSEVSKIDIAGSGNAEVSASRELDVDIAGSGNVVYKGNPNVKQSKMGSGSVRKG
jgi:hypothetical protein